MQRVSTIGFAGLQQQWVTSLRHGEWIETEHRPRLKSAAGKVARCHQHYPVERSPLLVAALAALMIVLTEYESVRHEHPVTEHATPRRQSHCVGNPGRSRSHSLHADSQRSDHHVFC